ncbi:hypothetical protein E3T40_13280 [Cryobacterium sp. TMT1-19]|nr:hypothetical protein E3T40_13280 [Cryobacterium sp. TMT1-19]
MSEPSPAAAGRIVWHGRASLTTITTLDSSAVPRTSHSRRYSHARKHPQPPARHRGFARRCSRPRARPGNRRRGSGIQPSPEIGPVTARAPVSGNLVRVEPHAFVIQSTSGTGILVHLGIDTVHMNGEGFEVLATEGSTVRGRCGVWTCL